MPSLIERKMLEMQMLKEIVHFAPMRPASRGFLTGVQRLVTVLKYIEEHQSEPLRRDELAAIVNLSPRYFDAIFKQIMHLTPQDYIKRLRIQRAQEMLLQTDASIAEVALMVGYRDPFHFSRQFHALCGISPLRYRQHIRRSILP